MRPQMHNQFPPKKRLKRNSGTLTCFLRKNAQIVLTETQHKNKLRDHAQKLCGREKYRDRILHGLQQNRLLIVEGPAGSGKRFLAKHCLCLRHMQEAGRRKTWTASPCKLCGATHAKSRPTHLFDSMGIRELQTMRGSRFTLLLDSAETVPIETLQQIITIFNAEPAMQLVITCVDLFDLTLHCASLRTLTYGKEATASIVKVYPMTSKERNKMAHFFVRAEVAEQKLNYRVVQCVRSILAQTPACDLRQLRINVRLNKQLFKTLLRDSSLDKPVVSLRDCTQKIWDSMLTIYHRKNKKSVRLLEAYNVRDKSYMERFAYAAMPNQVTASQMPHLTEAILRRSDRAADIRSNMMNDTHLALDLLHWGEQVQCVDPRGRKVKQWAFPALIKMDMTTLPFFRHHRPMIQNIQTYGRGGIVYNHAHGGTSRISNTKDARLTLRLLHMKHRTPEHVDFCRSIQPNGYYGLVNQKRWQTMHSYANMCSDPPMVE